ncbi:transporter [uncultured Thiodictyon sp.]|uniref:SphA family protein n=1 Tax=uncultured Thiodictyon sp. TaxID=1846217 RepID=UPI0025FAF293|nr:transporter [uncultured Thiodictyon sp.]
MKPANHPPGVSPGTTLLWSLALTLALGCPGATLAAEGGVGHYLPGGMATLIDRPPTKLGWVVEPIYLHYEGSASASRAIPIAGTLAAGLNASSDALLLGGLYTFAQTPLGAHYSVGAYLPYVWASVSAQLDTPLGTVRRRDRAAGVGDLTLIPAMLAWQTGFWQLSATLPVYAPTGEYRKGRLANPGLNYWTFDPTLGVSYNNDKSGLNAALYLGLGMNTENRDTRYRSGSTLHLDASIQQLLPLGPGFLGIGAEAFYLEQVTADSGAGARLGHFQGRTAGVGPVLSYILPRGPKTFAAELRWLPELHVSNRLTGDYVWLKLVYKF